MATTIAKLYEKFHSGDPLTDTELSIGIQHFGQMADLLQVSGPVFRLAAKEAAYVAMQMRSYRDARDGKTR